MTIRSLTGDNREVQPTLPAKSVHAVITSPPYYGLRDYGTGAWSGGDEDCDHTGKIIGGSESSTLGDYANGLNGDTIARKIARRKKQYRYKCKKCGAIREDRQIGLEETPEEYVAALVDVFRQAYRVLRDDGTLWLNLGDSYANDGKWGGETGGKQAYLDDGSRKRNGRERRRTGLKSKDRIGIPHMVVFALRAAGWYWRDEIVWNKPNPMTESVRDRCTKAHEFVFMFSKRETYYYDNEAIKEEQSLNERTRRLREQKNGLDSRYAVRRLEDHGQVEPGEDGVARSVRARHQLAMKGTRNKRSVWTVATRGFADAHFATFPPDLIEPAIRAATSEHGCCVDCAAPFRRVVKKGQPDLEHQRACGGDVDGKYTGESRKFDELLKNGAIRAGNRMGNGAQNPSEVKARILDGMRERFTIGWYPTCDCAGLPRLPKYPRKPTAPRQFGKAKRAVLKAFLLPMHAWVIELIDAQRAELCAPAMKLPTSRPVVLDNHSGAGTTGLVCDRFHRDAVLIDLNGDYTQMQRERLTNEAPLFVQVSA